MGNRQVEDAQNLDQIEKEDHRISTAYYKYIHNDLDAGFENLVYINFIDLFVRSKGLKIVNTCTRRGSEFREAITSEIVYTTAWNQVYADLTFDDYLDFGTEDDGHPNVESHQSFAGRLVDHIKSI